MLELGESMDVLPTEPKSLPQRIRVGDLDLLFYPNFYSEEKTAPIMQELAKLSFNTDEETSVVLGSQDEYEIVVVPRKQVAFADGDVLPYRFAGTKVGGRNWPPFLEEIRDEMNEYLIEWGIFGSGTQYALNYCLVNYYPDGNSSLGPHRDDTRDLQDVGGETIIVSLSFGAARDFVFQKVDAPGIQYKLPLRNGDLLIMRGLTNKKWKHSVPKAKRPRAVGARYNLTFRIMKKASKKM